MAHGRERCQYAEVKMLYVLLWCCVYNSNNSRVPLHNHRYAQMCPFVLCGFKCVLLGCRCGTAGPDIQAFQILPDEWFEEH